MTHEMDAGRAAVPALSVVVIGRDEGPRLAACLESVQRMEFRRGPVELIYVDSASRDGSPELAESLGAGVVRLQGRTTAARGRNAGWRAARAAFVLFLDGDTIVHPHFAEAALERFADPTVAAVAGDIREISPPRSLFTRVMDLDWQEEPGEVMHCGGNALMRRDVLAAIGGFDEELPAGEEPELCRRMRMHSFRILRIAEPMVQHDLGIMTFAQYWRRAYRCGIACSSVSERYRHTSDPLWLDQSRHNLVRGALYLALLGGGLIAGLLFLSPYPAAAGMAVFLTIALRTSWKARYKSSSLATLIPYGIHSHLHHVPAFLGQISFRWSGRRALNLDYRKPPAGVNAE